MEVKKVKDLLNYLEVLDFSFDICERYGKLVNELPTIGTPIGDLDTIITSLALTHNETLVTKNKEHFEKVLGLIVETW